MNKKEWDKGYQDAIQAIEKAIKDVQSGKKNSSKGSDDDLSIPMPSDGDGDAEDDNGGKDAEDQNRGNSGSPDKNKGKGDGDSSGSGSRDSGDTINGSSNVGEVRPEDCTDPTGQVGDMPGQPGTFSSGDFGKIAKAEGYSDDKPTDSAVEKDWKDTAIRESSKLRGEGPGSLKSKIEGLYKTSTDWKKALRRVVGRCINQDDKRQAYANKNVLTSQDRIARTDKDKYDCVDYIMAVIDTSGSVTDKMLQLLLSEVYQVALQKKPVKLDVVLCDARIQSIVEFRTMRDLKNYASHATVLGRGGTDFSPIWTAFKNGARAVSLGDKERRIAENWKRIPSELVMIFTDGYCTQYKRDPLHMKNLCWVIVDNPGFNIKYKDQQTMAVYLNSKELES